MMPFLSQPAVAPACYVPRERDAAAVVFGEAHYLTRTPIKAGHIKKWSFRASLQINSEISDQYLLSVYNSNGNYTFLFIRNGSFAFHNANENILNYNGVTRSIFRDYVGWLDILLTVDAEIGTVSISVNGVPQELTVSVNSFAGKPTWVNTVNRHAIGASEQTIGSCLRGIVADAYFIDGAVVPPSLFGEASIHGVWVSRPRSEIYAAIAAAGGWGGNGYHLDFSDPLAPGADVSGQGNHWQATGFDSVGRDTVTSTPTNVYAALNPLCHNAAVSETSGGWGTLPFALDGWTSATIAPRSGHWYCEVTAASHTVAEPYEIGIARADRLTPGSAWTAGQMAAAIGYNGYSGTLRVLGSLRGYGAPYSVGDVIGVEWDIDAGRVTFYRNSVSQGDLAIPLAGYAWAVVVANERGGGCTCTYSVNFGQRPFVYPLPTGSKALCTANLPEPDIKDPSEGLAQASATGANIVPVLASLTAHWNGQWVEIIKRRDAAEDWRVRFSDDPANSMPLNSAAGKAAATALVAGGTYWGCRLRVGSNYGVATAEVIHTTGTATTVTHGLGKTRNSVILKVAGAAGGDWRWWHPDMTPGQLSTLNGTAAADGTITAIGVNSFQIAASAPSGTYRWLVVAEGAGHICLTSHLGTGTADAGGAFEASTVRPDLVISRRVSTAGDPMVVATALNQTNPATRILIANSQIGETAYAAADLVVGGVKLRGGGSDAYHNTSGAKYVSIQIGRPIGGVCVAPTTAR
ncbi:SPRY domain-containing protein [Magnetospirillum fulvum]|uniref:B30.2/SPRY domain-containing protein n=1 Tax=Magnetospirillum fulvum MGU-K5 TaxID=1316936 RepID=S9SB72_MAGFU|nr:SPRY domain-containing protein [Magnetospirillum fulvum]EPY01343.1 hypothetical protein K678_11488 [Magnetospirillum fulvum MGU-K5]